MLPLGWPGPLKESSFQNIGIFLGGFGADVCRALEVAVGFFWGDLGVTLGFFRESRSFVPKSFVIFISNQWLDPMGTCPSAGICVRRPLDPE